MIITVRLNNDDSKIFRLVSWNAQDFANSTTIKVQGDNLQTITSNFESITKLEVFQDGNLVATYTDLDSFSEISYLKNEYCPGESRFTNAFRIQLTKIDIISQIQRLDEQINPVVDIDAMTLEQTKEYKIGELGQICRAEIYAGENITMPDGSVQFYTYNQDDQANILSATTLAFAAKTMGFDLDYIPYHASHEICQLLSTQAMVTIYMTLQLRLTRLVTKCNMLNCMIRAAETKADVLAITWDTQLDAEYQTRYDEIMTAAIGIANAMAQAMQPTDQDPEPEVSGENNGEE